MHTYANPADVLTKPTVQEEMRRRLALVGGELHATQWTDPCRLGPRRGVGDCTPYLTDWWLPLRELEKEMPISSSDDTEVVAKVRLGKLVRYRAKVTVKTRSLPCCSLFRLYLAVRVLLPSQSVESFQQVW